MDFSFLRKTEHEKTVDALLSGETTNYINEANFEKILRVYKSSIPATNPAELTKYILKKATKANRQTQSLKFLILLHKLTHSLGSAAFNAFANEKFPTYHLQKTKGRDRYSVLSHIAFIECYQNYLVRLIHNYEDLKVALGNASDETEAILTMQNVTIFHLISKMQNILHHLLRFDLLFEVCLVQYPGEIILKQAAFLILCDITSLYNFVNKKVHEVIGQVYTLPTNEAIFLYELFCEYTKIGKKIKNIMQFKVLLKDFQILEPIDLTLPQDEIKQMKLFMNSLKARVQIGMLKLDVKYNLTTQDEQEPQSPEKLNTSALLNNSEFEQHQQTKTGETERETIQTAPNTRISSGTPSFKMDARFSFSPNFIPLRLTKTANQAVEVNIEEEPDNAVSPDSFRYMPKFPNVRSSIQEKEGAQEIQSPGFENGSLQDMPVIPEKHHRFTLGRLDGKKNGFYKMIDEDKSPKTGREMSETEREISKSEDQD